MLTAANRVQAVVLKTAAIFLDMEGSSKNETIRDDKLNANYSQLFATLILRWLAQRPKKSPVGTGLKGSLKRVFLEDPRRQRLQYG
jgi:hypothetical protein